MFPGDTDSSGNELVQPYNYPAGSILIVAGTEDSCCVELTAMLKHSGYITLLTGNPERAIQDLSFVVVDLIMVDVLSTQFNGFDFLKSLSVSHPSTCLVALCDAEHVETANAAIQFGARDYIIKPFSPAQVLNRVRSLVLLARADGETPIV